MRSRALACVAVLVGLLVAIVPIGAHHAFADEFDLNWPVTLRGRVTRMKWSYPHAWVYIDVKGDHDLVVNWAIETAGPAALFRRGWRMDSLPVGAVITVEGYRARNGNPVANARNVTLPDGRKLLANR